MLVKAVLLIFIAEAALYRTLFHQLKMLAHQMLHFFLRAVDQLLAFHLPFSTDRNYDRDRLFAYYTRP